MARDALTRIYVKAVVVLALAAVAAVCIWQKKILLGLDLRGGSELLYRIRTENLSEQEKRNLTQRTIDVIRRRIDPEGRLEMDIRPRGKYRFYIQLPGMGPEQSRRIEELIRRAGKLRFCLVNENPEDLARARKGEPVPGHTPFLPVERDRDGRAVRWRRGTYQQLAKLPPHVNDWLLVENLARVTGEYLADPHPTEDSTGLPAVGFRFRGKGRVLFERLTEENQGRRLAIILDEDLYSAPKIEERIAGAGIIRGHFTRQEVNDLVAVLRAGQLPADIELEWNNTVGAQLGEDSIRAGIRASIIALTLTVAFMVVYYLATGAIADFALMLNLLLVLGAMSAMELVLTLPGIAGLVLTLGMAVDANVLINERIREERNQGKTLRLAIRNGYERAFTTILDSNLTTLITALILFGVGTGPVRGFATTLSLGIVISMFTAIWVTRIVVDLLVEKGWLTSLRMLGLVGRPGLSFSRIRHLTMAASALCIVAGLAVFSQRYAARQIQDTDLTGGFRAEMEFKKGVPIEEFRRRVQALFPNSDVQSVWSTARARERTQAPRRFSIRIRELDQAQKLEKVRRDLERVLRKHELLASLEQGGPWQFKVRLVRGVTEAALRQMLSEEGYNESDIREVVVQEASASEFLIRLRPAALDQDADLKVARVLDALDPLLVSQEVRIRVGEIVREELPAGSRAGGAAPRVYLPIKLGEICSTAAVREALVREVLGGRRPEELRVVGHGADQDADICREVAVQGSESDLRRIREAGKTELRVWSFSVPGFAELQVSLSSPQTETVLRDTLHEEGVLEDLVRSVLPLGVEATGFTVYMSGLPEHKAVEKIKEDLLSAFSDELAAEKAVAALEPAEPPADLPREEAGRQGVRYFRLTLDHEMQLQEIQAALARAGYPDALVNAPLDSETARRHERQVMVRLPDDERKVQQAAERIRFAFAHPDPFRSIEAIGPVVAGELRNKAVLAVLLSWVAIIFYIWFRFGEVKFGLAAVVALIHDVLMTAGAVGVADALSGTRVGDLLGFSNIKINITMIAAFLTLVGYSINDTIVVFDRIRENMGGVRRRVDAALIDASVNQIFARTVLTSLTTLMVLLVLYVMGGPVIHGFAFVMGFGVLVGTYSSIFIASPILIGWESFIRGLKKVGRLVTFRFA